MTNLLFSAGFTEDEISNDERRSDVSYHIYYLKLCTDEKNNKKQRTMRSVDHVETWIYLQTQHRQIFSSKF